jgi:hypothetical protein
MKYLKRPSRVIFLARKKKEKEKKATSNPTPPLLESIRCPKKLSCLEIGSPFSLPTPHVTLASLSLPLAFALAPIPLATIMFRRILKTALVLTLSPTNIKTLSSPRAERA